jgi:hypothetical protein
MVQPSRTAPNNSNNNNNNSNNNNNNSGNYSYRSPGQGRCVSGQRLSQPRPLLAQWWGQPWPQMTCRIPRRQCSSENPVLLQAGRWHLGFVSKLFLSCLRFLVGLCQHGSATLDPADSHGSVLPVLATPSIMQLCSSSQDRQPLIAAAGYKTLANAKPSPDGRRNMCTGRAVCCSKSGLAPCYLHCICLFCRILQEV